jgi:hypothetical protein
MSICLVANGGKADIVERRGDLKEMVTGMELASPCRGKYSMPAIHEMTAITCTASIDSYRNNRYSIRCFAFTIAR